MVNGVRSNAGHSWSWKTASQIWFKTQIGRALVELRSPASSHILFKQFFREFFWVVLNFLMFLILDSFMGFRVPLFELSVILIFDIELSNVLLSSIVHPKIHVFFDSVPFGCGGVGASGTVDPRVCRFGFEYWFRRFRPGCGRFHFQSGGTLAAKQFWGQKDLEDLDGFTWQGDCVAL